MKIFNRQARHHYHIISVLEAGIVLQGIEVKAVRENRIDLGVAFARVQNSEVYLKNVQIFPPKAGFPPDYVQRQDHKLLLHKTQINTLAGQLSKQGVTLIPLSIYTTRNYIKVELAVAQSKTQVDKRKAIRERDINRDLEQELKRLK